MVVDVDLAVDLDVALAMRNRPPSYQDDIAPGKLVAKDGETPLPARWGPRAS
jgi:hypothetical protein